MAETSSGGRVSFGVFEVDLRSGELRRQGIRIKLQDQPFQILSMLLEHPGELVTREHLRQRLWPEDTFVDFDVGLNSAVRKLRDALGDSADTPRYIETLPRRGYRLIVPVDIAAPAAKRSEPQAAANFLTRTRWLVMVVLLVLGGLAGYFLWLRPVATPHAERVMLAVLPFVNLTGDPAQEYFNDGFTEEMIAWLGQYQPEQLGVIARTSVMRFKGTGKGVAEIGRELGVDYVLEGSVRRESDRVRITAQLIRVKDQTHLWSKSYDRELRHILPLQNEVAGDIAREIHVRLASGKETGTRVSREVDPQAYEAYVRGLFFGQRRDKESLERAIVHFEDTLQRDPSFAMALVALARAHVTYAGLGYGPTAEEAAKAVNAAKRALELQRSLGEANAVLVWAHLTRWEWTEAEKAYRRAIELSPNDPIAHLWYGHYLLRVGRFQESLIQRQRAYELDPLDTLVASSLARNLYEVGRKAEALERIHKSQELQTGDAGLSGHHFTLGWYYLREGDYLRAKQELEEAVRRCRRCSGQLARLGHILALSGDADQAKEILRELQTRPKREFLSPFHLAYVHAGLGEFDQAFALLEQSYEARDFLLFSLREDTFLAPLRSDARFQNLLRRMNFPEAPPK